MPAQTLSGKVAVVTGASSGIGRIIAEWLGMAGAHVFMSGRSMAPMEASKDAIEAAGVGASLHAFDMRDEFAVKSFVESAAREKGRLDIIVNNAGLGNYTPIADADPAYWREMLEVNVLGLLAGCQAAIQCMRATGSSGHIINISSIAAFMREAGAYGDTKAAVNVINSTLRQQLEDDPIRVTAIMPGAFMSNFARSAPEEVVRGFAIAAGLEPVQPDTDGHFDEATLAEMQRRLEPTVGDPKHIADLVHYIISLPQSIQIEEVVIRPPKAMPLY